MYPPEPFVELGATHTSGRIQVFRLTLCSAETTIARAMSQALPENVDAWRMVQARRRFEGKLALSAMPRLAADLAEPTGDVVFDLEFDKDELGVPYVHVRADAALPLICQRSLDRFELPVHIDTRLGLISHEADEAGLPAGYEPLLTADGTLSLADVVEDELILAVPAVPVRPGSDYVERSWGDDADEPETAPRENPFEALKKIKISR
jgi:uncharacterized protein